MKNKNKLVQYFFLLLTLAALPYAVVPAGAQTDSTSPQNMSPQNRDSDNDITRRQLGSLDTFLDDHPETAEQLRKDPSLINNQEFVQHHPELQQYLQEHPNVREELSANPNRFMRDEERYDRREDDRGRDRDRDITHGELANMDRFMDSHPEIAEQLRKDPSLVDNKEFVSHHQALQEFLAEHPGVREEFKENPNAFMHREERFDRREDSRGGDITHAELANMDRFMDKHPEIAEQLRKDPSLVDNKEFVDHHQALQQFLAEHPGVREEFKENPNAFMHREERFDRREDFRNRDGGRGEFSSFNEFLGGHSSISNELSRDPSLANNKEYLETHPALNDYLKAHPEAHKELSENPQSFVKSSQQFNANGEAKTATKVPTAEPKNMADPKK